MILSNFSFHKIQTKKLYLDFLNPYKDSGLLSENSRESSTPDMNIPIDDSENYCSNTEDGSTFCMCDSQDFLGDRLCKKCNKLNANY